MQLRVLADARAFDELRVYKVDRLTRSEDLGDRVEPFRLAKRAGALIVDCAGKIIDPKAPGGAGELVYQLDTWMAAQERERIRDRTMAGKKQIAAMGSCLLAGRRMGLTFVSDRAAKDSGRKPGWALNEREAATYRGSSSGCGRREPPADGGPLHAEGVPSPGARSGGRTRTHLATARKPVATASSSAGLDHRGPAYRLARGVGQGGAAVRLEPDRGRARLEVPRVLQHTVPLR
jgi:hypothetical protein